MDIVLLGDGYTNSEMSKYATDANNFINALFAQEPFREYQRYFNVHRVDVISNESGIDHPDQGVFRDTALDGAYSCGGGSAERCICVSDSKVQDVFARTPGLSPAQRDFVIVIANDPEYGGCARNGIAAVYNGADAGEVILHELGHTLGLLADEYCYPPPPCGGAFEPPEVNATPPLLAKQ